MKTKITELLGIKYPVFQGAMAWIADAGLAAAVSNAGGLGIIAAGAAPVEFVRDEIRRAKQLTDKPFAVNIMLLNPNAPELAQLVIDEGVKVVTTGAGSPAKYMKAWKEAGIKVIPVIASTAYAKRMERMGADAVIAEGMESGGHIGETTTMALLPQVVDAVSIPVICAGGVADGRGMAAARIFGAEGVQCGTIFLSAEECNISQQYKDMVYKANDISTVVTGTCLRPSGPLAEVSAVSSSGQDGRTHRDAHAGGDRDDHRGFPAQGGSGRQCGGRNLHVRTDCWTGQRSVGL